MSVRRVIRVVFGKECNAKARRRKGAKGRDSFYYPIPYSWRLCALALNSSSANPDDKPTAIEKGPANERERNQ